MLAIPPFWASSNIALWRANHKPPLEVVVANLDMCCMVYLVGAFKHSVEGVVDKVLRELDKE